MNSARLSGFVGLAFLAATSFQAVRAQEAVSPPEAVGQIERIDPALDELIDPSATIELLATGFNWSEGPVWVKQGGFVIFSDVPENVVYKWKEGEGLSEYLRPSGYTGDVPRGGEMGSNGLAFDNQGRLLLCQHGDRRVARMDAPPTEPEPQYTTIVGEWDGKKFNSPNDLAVHSSGAIYFTDPAYGMPRRFEDPNREIPFAGVYRYSEPDGLALLDKTFAAPNGVALSPDEKTLYVAQSDSEAPVWKAFDVKPDGMIENGRVLFDAGDLARRRRGNPDGLELDQRGNLFATGPGGVLIISSEGKHLGTIMTGDLIANCAFGDDGQTLYMTCDGNFCRVRLKTTGVGF